MRQFPFSKPFSQKTVGRGLGAAGGSKPPPYAGWYMNCTAPTGNRKAIRKPSRFLRLGLLLFAIGVIGPRSAILELAVEHRMGSIDIGPQDMASKAEGKGAQDLPADEAQVQAE